MQVTMEIDDKSGWLGEGCWIRRQLRVGGAVLGVVGGVGARSMGGLDPRVAKGEEAF